MNKLDINRTYRIQNQQNNFTLDASTADNHTVACWNTTTGANQEWVLKNGTMDNYYVLENVYSKKFLATSRRSLELDPTQTIVDVVAGYDLYNWNLTSQDNKTYTFYSFDEVYPPVNSAFQNVTNVTNNNYTVEMGIGNNPSHKWIFTGL